METQCDHRNTDSGVCKDCGLCLESELALVDRPSQLHLHAKGSPALRSSHPMKYSFYSYSDQRVKAEIIKTLACRNAENYAQQVVHWLPRIKETKMKLSISDKTLVILYHLQKREGIPVVFKDIETLTRLTKNRFLLVCRDTFPYSERTDEYLQSLYRRCKRLLEMEGIKTKLTIEQFRSIVERYRSMDQQCLCYGSMLAYCDGRKAIKRASESTPYSYGALKRVVDNVKGFDNIV